MKMNRREAWARRGAAQAFREHAEEILAEFPDAGESLTAELTSVLKRQAAPTANTIAPDPAPPTPTRKRGGRHRMSEEGRLRIAEAQRKRWARIRRGKGGTQ